MLSMVTKEERLSPDDACMWREAATGKGSLMPVRTIG